MRDEKITPPQAPTIIIDTREQLPYSFADIRSDKKQGRHILAIPTVREFIPSGDYSVMGFNDQVAVERKSFDDLFGTLGSGRERFEKELMRLGQMTAAWVVVESPWSKVLEGHPRSQLKPKTIHRSVIAWQLRFPIVHWWFVDSRRMGELTTYRLLERFWKERMKAGEVNASAITGGGGKQ
jgi:DNA excision repair protein ERCC-4